MSGKLFSLWRSGFRGWLTGVLVWGLGVAGLATAQTETPVSNKVTQAFQATEPGASVGKPIVQTGCSSCTNGLFGGPSLGDPGPGYDGGCCGGVGCGEGCCYPGKKPCDCCCSTDSCLGKIFCGFYQCVCCPDPCYEPHWVALADSAFFAETPRPVTQLKLRYDHAWHMPFPDKAEFFMARADGRGKGPRPLGGAFGQPNLSYRELYITNETAIDRFSMSISMPYRQVSPDQWAGASGFSDLIIGTKSLLLDCELMQISFGMRTFIPTGNFNKGLGTGHVSLEPNLLWALKCTPESYHQGEIAYRIPIGGSRGFEGPVLHYHLSYNHLLWNCGNGVKLIGVGELNGYQFAGGGATAFVGNNAIPISAKNVGTVFSVGPGIRLVVCDKIDFGIGSAFALTNDSVGDQFLRMEFRWRF